MKKRNIRFVLPLLLVLLLLVVGSAAAGGRGRGRGNSPGYGQGNYLKARNLPPGGKVLFVIDDLGAKNVATVWQASNYPFDSSYLEPDDPDTWKEEGHWELWYPGDEAVDWVGMSYFCGANSFEDQWGCNMDAALDGGEPPVILNNLLDFARERRKPVMIAEAAPTAYDLEENTLACMPVTSCGSIISASVAKGLRLA